MGESFAGHVDMLLMLLLVASATAICVKWIRVPYVVALVIVGLLIGICGALPPISMTPELVLVIFLPALLFEAAWNFNVKALHRDWPAITMLATLGVVMCMFAVGAVLHLVGGLNILTALLFGALISATDPVSAVALFRKMGIDRRLIVLLEGESLFNDGTAVVLFKLLLAIVIGGGAFSIPGTILGFVWLVAGGAAVGCLIGFLASRITRYFDDHLLEITLTTITAYGSYLVADRLGVSAVIAVVAAGMVVGTYGSHTGMSAATRMAVNSFWQYAAFLVNSLLFLLIGLQIHATLLFKHGRLIAMGVVAVILARLLVVYGICPFVATKRRPIPDKWRHVLCWGGLRGALCMALALSLPASFADRELLINMTFGVVLFTLLVPGLSIGPLVKLLGLTRKSLAVKEYQELKAGFLAESGAEATLKTLFESGAISRTSYEALQVQINTNREHITAHLERLELADTTLEELQRRQAMIQLLETRKDVLTRLQRQGTLSDESLQRLSAAVDQELEQLQEAESAGEVSNSQVATT